VCHNQIARFSASMPTSAWILTRSFRLMIRLMMLCASGERSPRPQLAIDAICRVVLPDRLTQ
jgi:hypothetical protein